MIALIQRVKKANVSVHNKKIAAINTGILALIGIEKNDSEENANKLLQKIINYRIFNDTNKRMNLSLVNQQGALLLVSQFTLVANTKKGTRPGFSQGANPEHGKKLFNHLCLEAKKIHTNTQFGHFAADMQVELINDGPVTFWLQT